MFNPKAQATLKAATARFAELSVGDKVFASYDNGSKFVACRIYSIEEAAVKCLWNGVVFSVETELFLNSSLLIEKFNRRQVIAEILQLAGVA